MNILTPQTISDRDGLLELGDWTLVKDEADRVKFCQRFPLMFGSPVIQGFPALVQVHVSGHCDDDFSWTIITVGDAAVLLDFLTKAVALLSLWDKQSTHKPS